MRKFLSIVSAIWLGGCTFSNQEISSNWEVLKSAEGIDCGIWPKRNKDLSIRRIDAIRSRNGSVQGFLAFGTNRKGSAFQYYAPFDGDVDIDTDDFVSLQIGANSSAIGGFSDSRGAHALVLNRRNASSKLEVRNVASNIVKYSVDLKARGLVRGSLIQGKDTIWTSVESGSEEVYVAAINSKLKSKGVADLSFDQEPAILPFADSEATAIWVENGKFQAVSITGTKSGKKQSLDLIVSEAIESWSASADSKGIYIAYIDGDTLVGNAVLRVAYLSRSSLDDGLPVNWQKEVEINDTHVTEPKWVINGGFRQLLISSWLDKESTIARYEVSNLGFKKSGYSGVFAQGARVIDGFFESPGEENFVMVREKIKSNLRFKLCKL